MDVTAVVVSIVSLIGTIIAGILQFRKLKSEASNLDAQSTSNLVKLALEINKQDLETLRTVNADIKNEIKSKDSTIENIRKELSDSEHREQELQAELRGLKISLEAVMVEVEKLRWEKTNGKDKE